MLHVFQQIAIFLDQYFLHCRIKSCNNAVTLWNKKKLLARSSFSESNKKPKKPLIA